MNVSRFLDGQPLAKNGCTDASFRFRSNTLDPVEITNQLGIQPSWAWATGEKYLGKTWDFEANSASQEWRVHPWGMWGIDTKGRVESDELLPHILFLLDLLEPKREIIQHYLEKAEEYTLSFYILWESVGGSGGYDMPSDIMARMAALCHYTQFSFLDFPDDSEEES